MKRKDSIKKLLNHLENQSKPHLESLIASYIQKQDNLFELQLAIKYFVGDICSIFDYFSHDVYDFFGLDDKDENKKNFVIRYDENKYNDLLKQVLDGSIRLDEFDLKNEELIKEGIKNFDDKIRRILVVDGENQNKKEYIIHVIRQLQPQQRKNHLYNIRQINNYYKHYDLLTPKIQEMSMRSNGEEPYDISFIILTDKKGKIHFRFSDDIINESLLECYRVLNLYSIIESQ